jgi:hypothetical protein
MKTAKMVRSIKEAAEARDLALEFLRHGSDHDIYRVGSVQFSVVRHNETNELTAERTLKALESELGEGWWRR